MRTVVTSLMGSIATKTLILLAFSLHVPAALAANDLADPEDEQPLKTQDRSKSQVFVGAVGSFGQSSVDYDDASSGVSFRVGGEAGLIKPTGSWSRLALSGEAFMGNGTFSAPGVKGQIQIGLGALAKFGYGYSLGNNIFGFWTLGLGPALTKVSAKQSVTGATIKSKGTSIGFMGQLGFLAVIPMTDSLDVTGGVDYTKIGVDSGDMDIDGTTVSGDRYNTTLLEAQVGLRLRF